MQSPEQALAGVAVQPPTRAPAPPDRTPHEHHDTLHVGSPQPDPDPTRSPAPYRADDPGCLSAREFIPEPPPGYDLIRPLGSGGMATVYLAREHAAERTVAIKFLHCPTNPVAFDRFLVEARALARLDHPNIIKVITVETNWREPFLTMEYADGGTLAELVRPGGPLPTPADAARLIRGAAEAVAAAHAAGILHRDIKPNNVLLTTSGGGTGGPDSTAADAGPVGPAADTPRPAGGLVPKVSDFGLAKRVDRDDGLTRTGPIGTPGYMSPEAAAGRVHDLGPAADVYGLGATLYHLLTGRPPFSGADAAEVVRRVQYDPPTRPRAVRPDLPAALEGVVVKAMEKDPADRYPTAAALAEDLGRFIAGLTPAAPVLSPRRRAGRWLARHRARVGAAAAAVLLAAGLVAVGREWWKTDRTPPPAVDPEAAIRAELAGGRAVRLLTADGRPRVAGWPLGPAEMDASPADGGTCSFHSREVRVLLLLTDPGVDRYRVRAEICQRLKAGNVAPGPGNGNDPYTDAAGLVLGYAGQGGANGTRVHSMLMLGFTEFDGAGPPARRALTLRDLAVVDSPLAARNIFATRGVNAPLDPPGPDGPTWRPVVFEVTPAGVWTPGRAGLQPTDAATLARRRAGPDGLDALLAESRAAPTAPLPAWTPRAPVGVWSNGSWVAVRNVTIELLD